MSDNRGLEEAKLFFKKLTEKQIVNFDRSEWEDELDSLYGGPDSDLDFDVMTFLNFLCMRRRMTIRVIKPNKKYFVEDDFKSTKSWGKEYSSLKEIKSVFHKKGFRWIRMDEENVFQKGIKLIKISDKGKSLFENSKFREIGYENSCLWRCSS